MAAFADGEAHLVFHGDRLDELDFERDVIARLDHLDAFGEGDVASHVRRADVELGTVALEERRVAAALFLGEDVDRADEVRVRGDGLRGGENLAALDLFLLGAAEQAADVVAGLALAKELAEHFDAGDDRAGRRTDADDFDGVVDLDHAALDTAGDHGAAAFNGEDVFDRHHEGLVGEALGLGDVGVESVHELVDALAGGVVDRGRVGGGKGGAADHGDVVARELVLGEEFADFHLDEVEEFGIVNEVDLVQEDDDGGDADLAGEKDVLAGLGHRAVGGGDHDDCAVHLGRAGDHVLDEVRVAGAVDVRVVAVFGAVLDMRGCNRHDLRGVAAAGRFGCLSDLVVRDLGGEALHGLHVGDGRGKSGLAVVDMADRTDVEVRLRADKFFFCHFVILLRRGFLAQPLDD